MAALAGRQFGRISHRQLLNFVGSATIVAWAKDGYLHRVLPGVYAVGHCAPSAEADLAAAVLYGGAGAMLSHATAIWWLGLSDRQPYWTDVTTPLRARSRKRIRVHCRRSPEQRVWHNGLPVTSLTVALRDYAATATHNRLRHVLAEAEFKEMLELETLRQALGRGKPGSAKLRQALDHHMPQLARTRSELEREFLFLCEAAGIPLPEVNVTVEGILVDAYWRAEKVVVELDGGRAHGTPSRMKRDRGNELKLRRAGNVVNRYSSDQVTGEQAAVLADLSSTLSSAARSDGRESR